MPVEERTPVFAPLRLHQGTEGLSSLDLLGDAIFGALADVVGGAHGGVRGGDHRHQISSVLQRRLGIPHLQRAALLDPPQQHRGGPLPAGVDGEEATQQHAGGCVGIQLTDASRHDGPGHLKR